MQQDMDFDLIEGGIGVELKVDLAREIDPAGVQQLRRLLAEHHLFLVRDSQLSYAEQLRFASYFGTPLATGPSSTFEQYVSNSRADGVLGTGELLWHSDLSFAPEPYRVLGLYALEVADRRSSTRFADAARAYRTLPGRLRDTVAFRQVVNVSDESQPRGRRLASGGPALAAAAHSIVTKHPESGMPLVYVNELQSDCVLGMGIDQGTQLLEELFGYLYAPENIYEHRWQQGDFVLWDNLALQHARGDVSGVGTRTLRKVTLGPAKFSDQFPELFATLAKPYVNSMST